MRTCGVYLFISNSALYVSKTFTNGHIYFVLSYGERYFTLKKPLEAKTLFTHLNEYYFFYNFIHVYLLAICIIYAIVVPQHNDCINC